MPIIDDKMLKEFYLGDEDLLSDIADLFVANLPKVVVRLRAAITNEDYLELREVAHQFKSGLGYFFASDLNQLVIELEKRGATQYLEGCDLLSEKLFQGLHQLISELSEHTKNHYEIAF